MASNRRSHSLNVSCNMTHIIDERLLLFFFNTKASILHHNTTIKWGLYMLHQAIQFRLRTHIRSVKNPVSINRSISVDVWDLKYYPMVKVEMSLNPPKWSIERIGKKHACPMYAAVSLARLKRTLYMPHRCSYVCEKRDDRLHPVGQHA